MKETVTQFLNTLNAIIVCLFFVVSLCGCQDPSEIAKQQGSVQENQVGEEPQKQEIPPAVEDPVAENKNSPQNKTKKSIIGKTTAIVVDAKKSLANPDIEVVDGKIKGFDPFTQAGSAYVSMASRVSTLGMQQAIKLHKALNDRFPSYDEYLKMMKENRIEFALLPPYKMYGYDSETGNILVLQDNKKKAELYKKAGIPLD
ncbi:MAG: hypothetical protein QM501_07640 [Gimesia sp.]